MEKEKSVFAKTFVLLDAHAIIHRAYHALPSFTTPAGEPSGAVYGLASMLIKIIRDLKPDYMAAAFDLAGPTFRHVAYDQYKAKRPETAQDLAAQFGKSRELIKIFGIPIFDQKGFEADDIIGAITAKLKNEKELKIIIASGDLDALQLVDNDRVVVYTLRKGIQDTQIYNEEEVKKRFGFVPELLPDFKGLKGDSSDNIIGVKGIGEKTASTLIGKFGDLENVLKLAKKNPEALLKSGIKERIIKLLADKAEDALFSKELATIKKDVPVEFSLDLCRFRKFDRGSVETFFKELGFVSLLSRIPEGDDQSLPAAPVQDTLYAASSPKDGDTLYWSEFNGNIFLTDSEGKIFSAGEHGFAKVKVHRAYDAKKIMHAYPGAPQFADDLQIMFWLLNPGRTNPKLTDFLSLMFPAEKILFPEALKFLPRAYEKLAYDLREKNLLEVYRDIEMPLIPALFQTEKNGIACNATILKKASFSIQKNIKETEKAIYDLSGEHFNINSTRELSRILFEKLKISVKGIRKTDGGKISTQFSELVKLKNTHPVIQKIIDYRELAKISSTYTDSLPEQIQKDGRIYSTFYQTGTVTGRLSSADPNLQNIPAKSEYGDIIRSAFFAPEGKTLIAFDYSQMQLRIAAYLAQDKKMLEYFARGHDVHRAVAAEVFGIPEAEVTPEMRRQAKTINFGILYGMGPQSLSENLGVSRDEAEVFLQDYFLKFSDLARYFNELKEKAADSGFVETIFGRRRYLPEINSGLAMIKREAERMAMNTPIQGSEADIMKLAMIRTYEKILKDLKLSGKIKMILQIHDELLFECDQDIADYAAKTLKPIMENIIAGKITLPVDVKIGPSWASLEKHE